MEYVIRFEFDATAIMLGCTIRWQNLNETDIKNSIQSFLDLIMHRFIELRLGN